MVEGAPRPPFCYHENDTSFGGTGSVCTEYSAMAYTLFSVSTLSSRLSDSKVGQEIFYPYNASNSPTNYFYYQPGANGGACPGQTTVAGTNPTYHQWVSVLTYNPTLATDPENYNARNGPSPPASSGNRFNGTLSNVGGTVDKFYRLEVDSEQWNGWRELPGNCRAVRNRLTRRSPTAATDTRMRTRDTRCVSSVPARRRARAAAPSPGWTT